MIEPTKVAGRNGDISWCVSWRIGGRGGQRTSATFSAKRHPRKGEAEKLARRAAQLVEAHQRRITREQVYAEILGIQSETATATGPTLDAWFAEWASRKTDIESGTLAKYRSNWANHISPILGDRHVSTLEHTDVDDWINALGEKTVKGTGRRLSPKTIHRQHALLHLVLKAAVRAKHCTSNPALGTTLPKATHVERVFLTEHEAGLLLAAMDSDVARDMVRVMFATGMRWGEVTALQGRDLNKAQKPAVVSVARAWKKTDAGYELGEPKSARSRRPISIHADVVAILEKYVKPKMPMATLFPGGEDSRLDHSNFVRNHWAPAVRLARGLAVDAQGKAIPPPGGEVLTKVPTLHSTRHSHAAWLLSAGVPLWRVSHRLGHESTATTDRFYGHLVPKDDADVLEALPAI